MRVVQKKEQEWNPVLVCCVESRSQNTKIDAMPNT